jgi:hypothetical protein
MEVTTATAVEEVVETVETAEPVEKMDQPTKAEKPKKRKKKITVASVVNKVLLWICLILTLLPAYVMIVNSFKTPNQLLGGVLWFSFPLYFQNLTDFRGFKNVLQFQLCVVEASK